MVRHDNIPAPTCPKQCRRLLSFAGAARSHRLKLCRDRMIELDEAWELALAEAAQRARAAGRSDIASYLDLRRRNDLLRTAATEWLHQTVMALAADANRGGSSIQIEQQESHRFRRGSATMVGRQLVLKSGVRALTIESGWPRAPRDGIVLGNGLACANIKHLGKPRANDELLLVSSRGGAPRWLRALDDARIELTESDLRRHLSLLTHN